MSLEQVRETAALKFEKHFGCKPAVTAFAPGRVEVLGNHTDYNEGFVLSAAIDMGGYFMATAAPGERCRLLAADVLEECVFESSNPLPAREMGWANYVKGVVAGLKKTAPVRHGFNGLLLGNIPLGAGLSSSAALEMASGLCLSRLYGIELAPLALARIGQMAEHEYAGVKCGLMDQISSLFGRKGHLVMSDFRTMAVETVRLGEDVCFLMCNTNAKHSLVESAYNHRREACETAARYFAGVLNRPVHALRDVTWEDWERHRGGMDPLVARRAAHVIGENTRVLKGREMLLAGKVEMFGQLMFESHESSRNYFENSCAELDGVVDAARRIPGVLGARLSGGGFGGSVVILTRPRDVEVISKAISSAYRKDFGHQCDVRLIRASDGARVVHG